jgi:GNAT superfamily N-acetyltransferase
VTSAANDSLLDAVAANHRVWFRRCAVAERAGVISLGTDELFLGRESMIFPGAGLDVEALMAEVRARGCESVGCWALSVDTRLGTRLVARGFGWGWRPHWMGIDLDEGRREPASARFAVEPARPPYARTLPYAPTGPEPRESVRLGVRLREKVVGQVVVNPCGAVAGIYAMGVVPRARRRGIGLALTHAACRLAAELGCRHAVLNATDAGEQLYRRAGFRSLGWGQTWWYSGGPAPTQRETALTEAIGLGQLAALEDLRPTSAELHDPLPGGEHPLTLALLTDQPTIATYLLKRCPDLITRRSPPHGTTLLHLAVEHDRPAFAELALAHGTDLTARDDTFNATALAWAEHFNRRSLVARLTQAGARP